MPFALRYVPRFASFIISWAVQCSLVLAQPQSLTILHTNDLHAAFMPHEATWVKGSPKPLVGGFPGLAFVVDSLRQVCRDVLLLDAGDVMTGNPITERMYRGALGGALFEMMNRIGYDAWCPGNHDFDMSQDNLRALVRIARFPTLCANVVNAAQQYPLGNVPYALFNRDGLKIGVIGVMSQELYNLVNQNNLVGIRVLSPEETTQKFIDTLRPHVDLLIALTHQGVAKDSILAASVHGLDIIVGGHSHTRLKTPLTVNGVTIVQTGANAENLGRLDVTLEHHHVTRVDGTLIPLWVNQERSSSSVSALADSMQRAIDSEFSEVLGTLSADWIRSEGESAIGDFIADAQRRAAGAEIGFMNTHGIRRDASAGPLTKKTLFEILPFRNILTTFQLSGAELRAAMVYRIQAKSAIQIAGLSGRWRKGRNGAVEFVSLSIGGQALEDERMYTCAASDFFVGEAKRYLGVEIRQPVYLRTTVFEAVEKAVRDEKLIVPSVKDRIEQEP